MGRSRLPRGPASEIGLRPALKSMGTLARAALMTPPTALPAPTITWTMTAWARPLTMAKPWAMATAGTSCGTVIGLGAAWPCAPRFAYASMSGAKSVPALAKRYSTPRAARSSRYASAVLSTAARLSMRDSSLNAGVVESVPSLAPGEETVKDRGSRCVACAWLSESLPRLADETRHRPERADLTTSTSAAQPLQRHLGTEDRDRHDKRPESAARRRIVCGRAVQEAAALATHGENHARGRAADLASCRGRSPRSLGGASRAPAAPRSLGRPVLTPARAQDSLRRLAPDGRVGRRRRARPRARLAFPLPPALPPPGRELRAPAHATTRWVEHRLDPRG